MGKQSRQKRRSGSNRPNRPDRSAPQAHPAFGIPGPGGPARVAPEVLAAQLIGSAIHAQHRGDQSAFEAARRALVEVPDLNGWRNVAEGELGRYLKDEVTDLWERGWQPADVARAVGRRFGGRHGRLAADLIAVEVSSYPTVTLDPRWVGQLAEIEARVWWPPERGFLRAWCESAGNDWIDVMSMALELMGLLSGLPALEQLGPLPGTARPPVVRAGAGASASADAPPVDERMLSRIRGLLAKAEATQFPAEAEALTAAAQERMARYSIDAAMLAATARDTKDRPAGRRIGIDNPYESPKAILLNAVAKANRCRSVWTKNLGFCTVIGFEPDLDAVEALFTSLLVQATAAVTHAGSGATAGARSRTRAFRQSFLAAYAHRIGERLAEITQAQTQAAAAEPGSGNLLPVLASREQAVDDTLSTMFPTLTQKSAGAITDAEGWYSGRGAADLATLQNGAALRE